LVVFLLQEGIAKYAFSAPSRSNAEQVTRWPLLDGLGY